MKGTRGSKGLSMASVGGLRYSDNSDDVSGNGLGSKDNLLCCESNLG